MFVGAVSSLCALGKNGVDRADVYVGFQFDGFTGYSNIVTRLNSTRINFYSPPTIDVMSKVIGFTPVEETIITIKVSNDLIFSACNRCLHTHAQYLGYP